MQNGWTRYKHHKRTVVAAIPEGTLAYMGPSTVINQDHDELETQRPLIYVHPRTGTVRRTKLYRLETDDGCWEKTSTVRDLPDSEIGKLHPEGFRTFLAVKRLTEAFAA